MSLSETQSKNLSAMANRLRVHSIKATTAAGSGHPTTCCSAAEIMSVLFFHTMRYDPKDPANPVADRFVLSKGHAAPILYAAWTENGYYTEAELMTLRRIDSDLEGHPTPRLPYVDVATGSLGQGLGAGVGLALNSRYLDRTNYVTYVLMGDGEAAEGAVWEAAELGSHHKLGNLVAILDANRLGQSQATMLEHDVETYRRRFEAFGWNAFCVDGHDVNALADVLAKVDADGDTPTAIIAKTYKGRGVSFAEDKDAWHGKPFKAGAEADGAIAEITAAGVDLTEPFAIQPPTQHRPDIHPSGTMAAPVFADDQQIATREAYGEALVKLGEADGRVVVLDADTKNSTFADKFLKAYPERYFEAFIAEQNLISMGCGLAARGYIPFVSSFAVFLLRGFDQIRMAGISQSNIKYVGSHVGVSIGEDGPSQMALEDLGAFRAIPNCLVFYPSDAVSTERAVALAAAHRGPVYIRTSRPKSAVIYDANTAFAPGKCVVARQSETDRLTIVAGGVTLHESLKAADTLAAEGINVRIVDLFSVKPVDRYGLLQNAAATRNLILTVEDHYPEGGIGEAVSSALSDTDVRVHRIAVSELPRSGKPDELVAKYGIDAASIADRVRALVS